MPLATVARGPRRGGWCARPALRAAIALVAACVLVGALGGCASPPRPADPALPPQSALAPGAHGPLADLEAALRERVGPEASGFHLLEANREALLWRLAAVDAARHSLDLQYYVWFGDHAGQLLMARVLAAADRGVRVRILFDDLNTLLHDMSRVELRDATLAQLDRHRNIELRVFNAWRERGLLGRFGEALWDFERLNRRMHNKQMVADNRLAILGGRNIGNEYFGLNAEFNFHDLDVLGVGPVARQASAVFDRYWNSPWVRRIGDAVEAAGADAAAAEPSEAEREARAALEGDPRARAVLEGRRSWEHELAQLPQRLHAGRSSVHADAPSRAAGSRNHVPEAFLALMRSARREVLIVNAYIIPDEALLDDLRALAARGVRLRVLTNSLASHDVPAVNSHYERWRRGLIAAGVELHELRADAALRAELVDTPPVQGRFVGLHTKAMVIDRERAFIGSMNLDPRSEVLNAEMGILIESPPLAHELAAAMERDLDGRNSWRLTLDETAGPPGAGTLRWTSEAGTQTRQPARHAWQRLQNLLFKLLPPSLY